MASQGTASVPIGPSDAQVLITRWQLGRLGGALLISIYVAYVAAVFLDLV